MTRAFDESSRVSHTTRRSFLNSPGISSLSPLFSRSRCLFCSTSSLFFFASPREQKKKKVAADTGKIKAYREALADGGSKYPEIKQLRDDVNSFARTFPVIGFDEATMRYPAS